MEVPAGRKRLSVFATIRRQGNVETIDAYSCPCWQIVIAAFPCRSRDSSKQLPRGTNDAASKKNNRVSHQERISVLTSPADQAIICNRMYVSWYPVCYVSEVASQNENVSQIILKNETFGVPWCRKRNTKMEPKKMNEHLISLTTMAWDLSGVL